MRYCGFRVCVGVCARVCMCGFKNYVNITFCVKYMIKNNKFQPKFITILTIMSLWSEN